MLPHDPQDLATLQRRWPRAIAQTFDVAAIEAGLAIRPGEVPSCVFDFPEGLRLIISRERHPDGTIYRHISGSAFGVLLTAVQRGAIEPVGFVALMRTRYRELSGDRRPLALLGLSPGKGVPHLVRTEDS